MYLEILYSISSEFKHSLHFLSENIYLGKSSNTITIYKHFQLFKSKQAENL